ncbi:MAG: transcriptional regulator [Ahrensia sp.]|nr:transcriptional regulator [Ahrensia sp.]
MKEPQVKSIRALARGLEVLRMVQVSGAVSLNDLHRMSGIPKASLLRILKTLIEQGVVWQRIVDDAYIASYSLSELASRMDREIQLVEVASPILEALSDELKWPSVLAVPRLTHLEVIETNAPRSYFHHIPLGPVGFQINMLRSATGRAYIAYCEDAMREAILDALRRSGRKGDRLASNEDAVRQIIRETRERGFGLRAADFGGNFDEGRLIVDDGRDSIGVPIRVGRHVPGAINVTWAKRVMGQRKAAELLADRVQQAAKDIGDQLARSHESFTV